MGAHFSLLSLDGETSFLKHVLEVKSSYVDGPGGGSVEELDGRVSEELPLEHIGSVFSVLTDQIVSNDDESHS